MSVDIETMRKAYKPDEDLINKLIKMLESVVDFDRIWNGT